jgi:cationic peptide transport system ATP-binding protein
MSTPLLEIRQLYKSYQKAQGIFGRKTIQALSDVSFSLYPGQTLRSEEHTSELQSRV